MAEGCAWFISLIPPHRPSRSSLPPSFSPPSCRRWESEENITRKEIKARFQRAFLHSLPVSLLGLFDCYVLILTFSTERWEENCHRSDLRVLRSNSCNLGALNPKFSPLLLAQRYHYRLASSRHSCLSLPESRPCVCVVYAISARTRTQERYRSEPSDRSNGGNYQRPEQKVPYHGRLCFLLEHRTVLSRGSSVVS